MMACSWRRLGSSACLTTIASGRRLISPRSFFADRCQGPRRLRACECHARRRAGVEHVGPRTRDQGTHPGRVSRSRVRHRPPSTSAVGEDGVGAPDTALGGKRFDREKKNFRKSGSSRCVGHSGASWLDALCDASLIDSHARAVLLRRYRSPVGWCSAFRLAVVAQKLIVSGYVRDFSVSPSFLVMMIFGKRKPNMHLQFWQAFQQEPKNIAILCKT